MTDHLVNPMNSEELKEVAKVADDGELKNLFGTEFMDHSKNLVNFDEVMKKAKADKSYVCVYISAIWCPPCKKFTPLLSQFYKAACENKKSITIIFSSCDRNQKDFDKYFATMSFPYAFPLESKINGSLKEKFQIDGIPSLLIFDHNGTLITTKGVELFYKYGFELSLYDKLSDPSFGDYGDEEDNDVESDDDLSE